EANDRYWRKAPAVKRMVWKTVTEDTTRLAMLKRGEADVAYSIRGALAEEVQRSPGLSLKPTTIPFTTWIAFNEQWDPKSPWADRRVRLAANYAIDRKAINQAETLGLSKPTTSIIPQDFEFYWPAPMHPYDPRRAKQLLADAGYPNGFDGGEITTTTVYASIAEAVASYFGAVGIRTKLRPLERAAFFKEWQEKRLKQLVHGGSAAFGNAATRIEAFIGAGGIYVYGSYPDIEGLIQEQLGEPDRKRREAVLHRIQRLMHEKAMYVSIMEPAFLNGVGPRVAESGLGLITNHAYSAPYEDLKLKGK
ncbi:MAG TPA: ABC transporter substrate-binding protein, partial [Methylomirabilota bacterium]|nr:ABC transporter substrate-binding protein [Methylomirabilota bacterium]